MKYLVFILFLLALVPLGFSAETILATSSYAFAERWSNGCLYGIKFPRAMFVFCLDESGKYYVHAECHIIPGEMPTQAIIGHGSFGWFRLPAGCQAIIYEPKEVVDGGCGVSSFVCSLEIKDEEGNPVIEMETENLISVGGYFLPDVIQVGKAPTIEGYVRTRKGYVTELFEYCFAKGSFRSIMQRSLNLLAGLLSGSVPYCEVKGNPNILVATGGKSISFTTEPLSDTGVWTLILGIREISGEIITGEWRLPVAEFYVVDEPVHKKKLKRDLYLVYWGERQVDWFGEYSKLLYVGMFCLLIVGIARVIRWGS